MPEFRDEVILRFRNVQDWISTFINAENDLPFREDAWHFPSGEGGGRSRIWEGGSFLEKGGVNFSGLEGKSLPPSAATAFKIPDGTPYFASGVSLVLHPRNPFVPTIHMNIRYFEAGDIHWFGGGIDLTPYYPDENLVIGFHCALQAFCEKHKHPYSAYKQGCDEYFYLKHRHEARGVGGLFFDHLRNDQADDLAFVEGLGLLFSDLYRPFLAGKSVVYSPDQKTFQEYRRSRYAEFNLVYDRGTLFGLQSGGRVESILMSMPPICRWIYDYHPKPGSPEEKLTEYFLKPQDWVSLRSQ